MDLSKDSIVSRQFSKKFVGGLDEFEVRDFLYVVAEEIDHLTKLLTQQEARFKQQEDIIKDFRDRELILKKSIASAQSIADRIQRDAENQANLIADRANDRAESLVQDAKLSLQSVYNDISDLKRLHLQFKLGLKASLKAHLNLLDQEPVFVSSLQDKLSHMDGESQSQETQDKIIESEKAVLKRKEEELQKTENTRISFNTNNSTSHLDILDESDLDSLKESFKSLEKNLF